jgi:hypothetical protein
VQTCLHQRLHYANLPPVASQRNAWPVVFGSSGFSPPIARTSDRPGGEGSGEKKRVADISTAKAKEILARPDKNRMDFLKNTIALDQAQLVTRLELLGECRAEDESREGKEATGRFIAVVTAVGRMKYPLTFDAAVRDHFQGCDA